MKNPTKLPKYIGISLFILFVSFSYAQNTKNSKIKLPESVFGEWQGNTGNGEYNGLLIHRDFIEFGYRPFMYQNIRKEPNGIFAFEAMDRQKNIQRYQMEILAEDSIKLKRGDDNFQLFIKHKDPLGSKRVTMANVPNKIKKTWFTTDGENNAEFKVEAEKIFFRTKPYTIEEVVHFRPNETGEYRFIVKNGKDYRMFYFKNWDEHYLQVSFNGGFGDLYKANKDYPDYRINDIEEYLASKFPQELRGDWLKGDGSNAWAFSFYYDYAVLDKKIWSYKSVDKTNGAYKIILENEREKKTVYAKQGKNKTAKFGYSPQTLKTYTLKTLNKPGFTLPNDVVYKEDELFKIDSATYSGIIRGFNPHGKEKTGMVYVNNVFTGNQDSHLIKIQDDGSFSVKFPSYHPQQVYVRFPNYNISVLVEPAKETWQLINAHKPEGIYFTGDIAQLNTDLMSLEFITRDFSFYDKVLIRVDQFSLAAYKKECISQYNRQVQKRDSVLKTRFISDKALQVFNLDLDYGLYEYLLSYDIYSKDRNSSKINSAYMSFLTPKIYDNKLAVVSSAYKSFINRLRFVPPMLGEISVVHPKPIELAKILESKNIALTKQEKALVHELKKFRKENAASLEKQEQFRKKNQEVIKSYSFKLSSVYRKLTDKEKSQISSRDGVNINLILEIMENKGLDVSFTSEEIAVQKARKELLTEEEYKHLAAYYTKENSNESKSFIQKHENIINAYVQSELLQQQTGKIRENLGNTFSADVIMSQYILGSMGLNFIPLSKTELIASQKKVSEPFIAKVIEVENNRIKKKIETNKSKIGFLARELPKTEADNIFDAIISKYKGKVVFIDFWATWCAPCLSGIKKMKPLKADLEGKDIVFVYITNQSSPKTAYNNLIPDINGEHYRVSRDEWNYLADKFNITGIPHYTLVNKKGEVIKTKLPPVSHMDGYKQIFKEELRK
ncbi:TlpA family protein disulfide reductase [Salegentibacter echinorum]|nr:TlpA disulfide reductase family protein [Salegentibacter echinorum]